MSFPPRITDCYNSYCVWMPVDGGAVNEPWPIASRKSDFVHRGRMSIAPIGVEDVDIAKVASKSSWKKIFMVQLQFVAC